MNYVQSCKSMNTPQLQKGYVVILVSYTILVCELPEGYDER